MKLPSKVKLVEFGPRDGLQNGKEIVSTATKLELIERLVRTGLHDIEAASWFIYSMGSARKPGSISTRWLTAPPG